ncbi:hypothetical protein GCM10010420_48620 [Streptomyces glaucosporus]|uniref:Uncharacterized protein n=1 Tax=Streptomyces glaucosporus TaxID=284044 RepID=A0ABN3ISY3_9ACTN
MTHPRLAPGVAVVAVPGRGPAVRTADGEFLRVATGGVPERLLLDRLSGAGNAGGHGDPDGAEDVPPGLGRLLAAFASAGYTRTGPGGDRPRTGWPAPLRTVWLLGDAVLTAPLAECLRTAGAAPRTAAPEEVAALVRGGGPGAGRPAAVVWCLDGPVPPGLWDDADRLPALGTAWLRCHREGRQVWIEPPAVTAGDVTSAHVRLRRLAATPAHRELAAYWDGERITGDDRLTTPASAALTAALLAGDLAAWARGGFPDPAPGSPPARRRLRRVDLNGLTVTEHPVLPVPDVAPLPTPPAPLPRPRSAA